MTSDLSRRIWEHRNKVVPGFTRRYGVDRLVWFEAHLSAEAARQREQRLKEWKRDWKINLIERDNPHWFDLYPALRLQSLAYGENPIPAEAGTHRRHGHRPAPVWTAKEEGRYGRKNVAQ